MRARILLLALFVAPAASGCVCEEERRIVEHVRYTFVDRDHDHDKAEHRGMRITDHERDPDMRWFPTRLQRIEGGKSQSMVERAPLRVRVYRRDDPEIKKLRKRIEDARAKMKDKPGKPKKKDNRP